MENNKYENKSRIHLWNVITMSEESHIQDAKQSESLPLRSHNKKRQYAGYTDIMGCLK